MSFRKVCHDIASVLWITGIGFFICSMFIISTDDTGWFGMALMLHSILIIILAAWGSFPPHKSSKK